MLRKKNGLHDLMEIIIESIMIADRGEFLAKNPGLREMTTILAPRMDKAGKSSSAYLATGMATSICRTGHYRKMIVDMTVFPD